MTQSKRIYGYDFARSLAVTGMIFVNFKTVMVQEDHGNTLYDLLDLLSGKAAALFVVLAGVGMTLMYRSAKNKNNSKIILQTKITLIKRAAFLFVIGLSYYVIWPADILHYYGLYLSIGVIFLGISRIWLQIVSLFLIFAYSFLIFILDYETGWNFSTLEYTDFFTLNGFFRNLFFNGFHPVLPWIVFLLTGIWVGRINLRNLKQRKKTMIISAVVFVLVQTVSYLTVNFLSTLSPTESEEIQAIFGTSPMPPMPLYMLSGSSLAVFIIAASVWFADTFYNLKLIKPLISYGQLALTNYFTHVVIGMFGLYLVTGKSEQAFSIEFITLYALIFNLLMIIFSHYWQKKHKRGPIERLMRKIAG